jgi:hypothetical protein
MSSKLVTADYIASSSNSSTPPSSPDSAIEAVQTATAETPVILDFDETLFLRNSTEEYLNCVYPRPIGAVFLLAIKALKPWRLLPARLKSDKLSKDWCLVVAATLVFPWTLLIWQWRAKALARRYWNQPLVDALYENQNADVVVATLGFDVVVKPLLKHLPLSLDQRVNQKLIACRFWQGASDRARGKRTLVTDRLGAEAVSRAVVVTDSDHDAPLLAEVQTPCLVVWPEAEFVPAMADVYLPLFYSEKVKNPNKKHFIKRVLMGHWAFLAIALSLLSPHPVLNAACLMVLVMSYWCVYEIGYQENDLIGEQYEAKPILSETYNRYKTRLNLNTPTPWYWAMAMALPALFLVEVGKLPLPLTEAVAAVIQQGPSLMIFDISLWLAFLFSVRLAFWLYNRFNEEARIWIYPILQIQKLFGFTLLMGISFTGSILLLSLGTARWLHYCIYRCGGDRWRFPLNLCCLGMFVMTFFAMMLSSENPEDFLTVQAGVALAYCISRSIKPGQAVSKRIGLVGQPVAAPTPID